MRGGKEKEKREKVIIPQTNNPRKSWNREPRNYFVLSFRNSAALGGISGIQFLVLDAGSGAGMTEFLNNFAGFTFGKYAASAHF